MYHAMAITPVKTQTQKGIIMKQFLNLQDKAIAAVNKEISIICKGSSSGGFTYELFAAINDCELNIKAIQEATCSRDIHTIMSTCMVDYL